MNSTSTNSWDTTYDPEREGYTENAPPDQGHALPLPRLVFFYICPVIVALGLMGNLVSFVVMTSQRMRKHSSSVYLAVLAVADCVVILYIFIRRWLGDLVIGPVVLDRYDISCKLALVIRRLGKCRL